MRREMGSVVEPTAARGVMLQSAKRSQATVLSWATPL
jgi:hypothetical protein